jgi:acetyl-CoA acetyltransferase
MAALIARRQMHRYGIRREHYAEVAISQRNNAIRRPTSLLQQLLTLDDYFGARMVSDPLCLFDYTLESDGAVAVVTTSAARTRDLRHRPIYISASAMGGDGRWGRGVSWMGMPDDIFATCSAGPVARDLYPRAGVGPADVDVALSSTTSLRLCWPSWKCTASVQKARAGFSSPTGTSDSHPGRSP